METGWTLLCKTQRHKLEILKCAELDEVTPLGSSEELTISARQYECDLPAAG